LEDLLEEVVGEVRDEFDLEEDPPITLVEPGHLLVRGMVQLEELEDYVPLGLHGHDVHTVGGLVWAELGRRPRIGDEVEIGLLTLRVESIKRLSIHRVSIFFEPELYKAGAAGH
jgi:CBS domain containing-hemolysin-like protein